MRRKLEVLVLLGAAVLVQPVLASAKIQLTIVKDYASAMNRDVWKNIPPKQIPPTLLGTVEMDAPSKAYNEPYKYVYFQNDRVVVCWITCEKDQYESAPPPESDIEMWKNSLLARATIYYWANRHLDFLAEWGASLPPPERIQLIIGAAQTTNTQTLNESIANCFPLEFIRTIALPTSFFASPVPSMPSFWMLFALDPSVILHEVTHCALIPLYKENGMGENLANKADLSPLDEGLADFFADLHLNTTAIAAVAYRGEAVESTAATAKDFELGRSARVHGKPLEPHWLGHLITRELWRLREDDTLGDAPNTWVIQTLLALRGNPYVKLDDFFHVFTKIASAASNRVEALGLFRSFEISDSIEKPSPPPKSHLTGKVSAMELTLQVSDNVPQNPSDPEQVDSSRVRIYSVAKDPRLPYAKWYLASRRYKSEDADAPPLWLCYSIDRHLIYGAADVSGNPPSDSNNAGYLFEAFQATLAAKHLWETELHEGRRKGSGWVSDSVKTTKFFSRERDGHEGFEFAMKDGSWDRFTEQVKDVDFPSLED